MTRNHAAVSTVAVALIIVVLVAAVAVVYYATSTGAGKGGATVDVSIPAGTGSNNAQNYSPGTITVVIGVNNTVKWSNMDSAVHTVTANGGSFDSGDIAAGGTYTHTFTTPGTYSYHCKYHSWMTGTVIVKS